MASIPKTPKTPAKSGGPSTPGDTAEPPKVQPSVQEAYFFLSILKNQQNKPDVDWDKVAQESGFKNAETAKVRFGQIKRKLGVVTTPAGSKSTPRKRPAGDATPASEKKRKTAAAKKKNAATSKDEAGEEPLLGTSIVKSEESIESRFHEQLVAFGPTAAYTNSGAT